MQFDTISLDRAGAAAVVGITEPQIANWVTKYGLFPEKRQGKGAHFFFLFSDVVALATIKALMDNGVASPTAVYAVRPYSPYGCLLDGSGIFRLSQNRDGRWVGTDGPDVKVSLQVRMWAVFDDLLPPFCEQAREYAKAIPADRFDEIIENYRSEMNEIRARFKFWL